VFGTTIAPVRTFTRAPILIRAAFRRGILSA
jgi:hypothetical protein